LNGNGITVNGTAVHDIGLIPGLGESGDGKYSGLSFAANNINVSNCTLNRIGFNAVAYDGDNVLVEHNYADSVCLVKDDGGAYYTYCQPNENRVNRIIRNNIATNCIGNFEGAGYNNELFGQAAAIYLDGNTNHTLVDGNFCATGSWAGILNNGNSFNTITNNKVYDFAYQVALTQTSTTVGNGAVRNLVMTGNTLIARTAEQLALLTSIIFVADSPSSFGTVNNNTYARPIDDNQTIAVNRSYSGGSGFSTMTLAGWKTSSSLDAASVKSTITTSNLSDFSYKINPTTFSVNFPLGAAYRNVSGNTYSGDATISGYSGEVMLYDAALPGSSTGPGGWIIIKMRKVITQ
jgi:hypothetical protein